MKQLFILSLLLSVFQVGVAQSYCTEEIECHSDSVVLSGTLTYPKSYGKFPAIIIISGTGRQNRDGTFASHRPFYDIANYLTPLGFAVLRVDDRGVGKSTGVYEKATTTDFASDVLSEIEFLKTKAMIDTSHIGLIGHSEGGAVAFMVAASSPDVSFIISLAGLAVDGYTSLILQNRAILESSPYVKPELVDDYMQLYITLFKIVKETPLDQDVEPELKKAFQEWLLNQSDDKLKAMDMIHGHDQMFLSRYTRMAQSKWYREMIQYNPAKYITKVKIPVLALNGDKDVMVTPDENLSNIDKYLKEAGNKNYKIVRLKSHNHMFQRCVECTQNEIPSLPEAISPETLETMYSWLKNEIVIVK